MLMNPVLVSPGASYHIALRGRIDTSAQPHSLLDRRRVRGTVVEEVVNVDSSDKIATREEGEDVLQNLSGIQGL